MLRFPKSTLTAEVTVAAPGGKQPLANQLSLGIKGGVLPHTAKKLHAKLDRLSPVLEHPR